MSKVRTLGLIPARAGSKGIPGKNLRLLGGVPLIVRTIEVALEAQLDQVVVSTDGPDIAEVSKRAGARVPFLRPAELATDDAATVDVVRHALMWLRQREATEPETVVLLQPTSPLRTAEHIREALELFSRGHGRTVVSVTPTDHPPHWTYTLSAEGTLLPVVPGNWAARRQDLPPTFRLNGAIYVFPAAKAEGDRLWDERSLAYVMPPEASVDIDTELDWQLAEILLQRDAVRT
ncbi:acylneuraminate cytidylyltransferase family protein [Limnochorda pilosa]|uniref:CMP-N-acetlyneuraminic acid synthetase n=1 Tax=Limnochorda pilosa TaxID=1555112 RepID=A0A0K2SM87_LIMPI|nr:acylneuraminate cytidylyltransferase family protein [Limnochorda pilosa]BAS28215.1 CMP-N-acetlyneuraminic acid synthetase [Limnochorda pilosa]